MTRLLLAIALAFSALAPRIAMAVEEPAYEVLRELAPETELRAYAPMIVAEVDVPGEDPRDAVDAGFKQLAGYIFGGNQPRDRIGMTAPVQSARSGERIGMTAPVQTAGSPAAWTIGFVMPSRYRMDTLPRPNDPSIRLREVPARQVAALRFSGRWNPIRFAERQQALLRDVEKAGLSIVGEPWSAQYNPPWIPGFFRRNEVLVEVAPLR
ncbi:MAG: SOUL family heme-binding protein [Lysobacteraceae bacterium]